MSQQKLSRRDLLKLLTAAAGAAALSTVPNKWETPVVEIGALPAHAQASRQGTVTGTLREVVTDTSTTNSAATDGRTFTVSVQPSGPSANAVFVQFSGIYAMFSYAINNVPLGNQTLKAHDNTTCSPDLTNNLNVVPGPNTGPTFTFGLCLQGCLSGDTLIDTPAGGVRVTDIKPGMTVWTLDATGLRVPGLVHKKQRIPVPAGSVTVHLMLSDGREAFVSAPHPLTDGRTVGELAIGDWLDGARVTKAESVAYDQPAKYDLLVAGDTSAYWANGIPMNSTMDAMYNMQRALSSPAVHA
jgi:hypothetical protein